MQRKRANNSMLFPNKGIEIFYSGFHPEKADDADFSKWLDVLEGSLTAIDQNRDAIDICVIRSDYAMIYVSPNKECTHFTLIWDVCFWELYEYFCATFYSILNIMEAPLPVNVKYVLFDFSCNYLNNKILDYLINRFSRYRKVVKSLEKSKKSMAFLYSVDASEEVDGSIHTLCDIGKEFVLIHELEHILYYLSPEIYEKDSLAFDHVLQIYQDDLLLLLDPDTFQNGNAEYEGAVEFVKNNKKSDAYRELYNDFHAFYELLWHNNENLTDGSKLFAPNSSRYLFALKVLKTFESCFNFITALIETAVSTRFLPLERRIEMISHTADESQRKIHNRDYLSGELFFTYLLLQAHNMGSNLDGFAESHDTGSMVVPYTEVMQPSINRFINETVNTILSTKQ